MMHMASIAGFSGGPLVWGAVLLFVILSAVVFHAPSRQAARRLIALPGWGPSMQIRPLSSAYAVSPQIDPADLPAIREAGYSLVIDNRPDGEIPERLRTAEMAAAARAAGIGFVANPVTPGMFTDDVIEAQRAAQAQAGGPVLAYCASGNRSSCVWALMNAGQMPIDELVGTPAQYGYNLNPLVPMIKARAEG